MLYYTEYQRTDFTAKGCENMEKNKITSSNFNIEKYLASGKIFAAMTLFYQKNKQTEK